MEGTLSDAIRAREDLRDLLKREMDEEHKASRLGFQTPLGPKEILSAYAKRWLLHLAQTDRNRVHVLKHHVFMLDGFILPMLGGIEVKKLSRMDLATWMARLGDMTNKGKPYAKSTFLGAWATLRTMLKDALMLCGLDVDPTTGVRFSVRGADPLEKAVLTQNELGRLLAQTEFESPDVRAMIWLGFTTGMRFGELSALQWSDIDFVQSIIHVRKSQVGGVVGKTKTSTNRTVPLHPVVADILRTHRAWQEHTKVRGGEKGMLFPSKTGGHRFSNVFTKPLGRCAQKAGIDKHVTAHTMRRTFNNLARQAAGDIVARSMTGHTTSAMTEHYSHVTHEEKARAINNALGLLPGGVVSGGGGVDVVGMTENRPFPTTLQPY